MGFLKRILSLGSKKSRRKRAQLALSNDCVDEVGAHTKQPVNSDDDSEVAANLLLRSSSARYAVIAETDYTSLPPLPHPINSAVSTPSESTTSVASVSRRGTYVVTVHPRQRHTSTELPRPSRSLANDLQTPQPRRRAQTVGDDALYLRRDPSVASLLDLYDEHGQLPLEAFSNTPPKEGRAQAKRTGSTLRELLGDPASTNRHNASSLEGDISWAERFLGEANSAASSVSSLILQTPGPRFSNDHAHHDTTLFSEHDLSSSFLDNPVISSMEVELSEIPEISQVIDNPYITEHPQMTCDAKTPRKASEVFGFLTEKRKSRASFPDPFSAFSSPSDKASSEAPALSRFSRSSSCGSDNTAMSPLCDTQSFENPDNFPDSIFDDASQPASPEKFPDSIFDVSQPASPERSSILYDAEQQQQQQSAWTDLQLNHSDWATPSNDKPISEDVQVARKVKVIMVAPTKVIVTAPTPLANTADRPTASRIPRGPRSLNRQRSRSNTKEHRPGLVERSNSSESPSSDPFTVVPSRPMKLQRSSASLKTDTSPRASSRVSEKESKSRRIGSTKSLMSGLFDKENTLSLSSLSSSLSATPDLPLTPIRTNSSSSRSLLRSAVSPASFRPPKGMTPSPASSSELSPVGKTIMDDVRRQRRKRGEEGKDGGGRGYYKSERVV